MSSNPGNKLIFVVIEGIDRCGKNLQADYLARHLEELEIPVRKFSTPDYNGPSGEAIASYLAGRTFLATEPSAIPSRHSSMVLQSLLICNRNAVASQIARALTEGLCAVCVRWWQSALIYGQGDGIVPGFIMDACKLVPDPDLHLLLDVAPGSVEERLDRSSHYEVPSKQRALAAAYQQLWSSQYGKDPRWVVVRGEGRPVDVAQRIWELVADKICQNTQ